MKKQIREIRVIDLITYALLPTLAIAALWLLCCLWLLPSHFLAPFLPYALTALLTYPLLRRALIGAVLVYKAFAPLRMRGQCRFHPSCSTYMIMAIRKYGILIGVYKGVRRILRCKPPNGGEDYP